MLRTSRLNTIFFGVLLLFVHMTGTAQQTQSRVITIGTGGPTGIYYPLGGAICRLVNREHRQEGVRCLVDSTDGSIYNLNALRAGELDIAVAQSDQQYNAYKGKGLFAAQGPFKDLRALFSVHDEPFTVVARAHSDIKTLDDLKGKRVNIGSPGSGQRATMEVLMAVKGWSKDDFAEVTELGPAEQSRALCDNKVDAIVYTVGHPNRSILEATTACDSAFVQIADDQVAQFLRNNPHYTSAVIPGGMYRGNPEDTKTFGVKATVVASADIPAEMIYWTVKAVFENFSEFKNSQQTFANLTKESMIKEGNSAPFHEGALRYYKEAGLLDKSPVTRSSNTTSQN